MKKKTSTRTRGLQLSAEAIRTLSGGELSRAISGCVTTSDATDQTTSMHTDGATNRNCVQRR